MLFNQRYYQMVFAQRLNAQVLNTTNKVIYQAPPDANMHITQILAFNHGAGGASFNLHHVTANESATTANALYWQYNLSAKAPIQIQLEVTLRAGERLIALASAGSSINMLVYGHPL